MTYRPLKEAEMQDLAARILYEDNHLLVFCKRAGEIVQGDKTGDECLTETLKAFLAQRDNKPGRVFLGLPHRLDRPVSGITVFAKTSKALERLGAAFRDGDIHKTYWALSAQAPDPAEGELDDWLVRNEKMNKSFVVKGHSGRDGQLPPAPKDPAARLARLRYRTAAKTERYWLIEVELLTGRHHQIRCQLAHLGCPIKGDLKYGAPRSNPDGGISLHAREIRLTHPVRKTRLCITAPVPASWKGLSDLTGQDTPPVTETADGQG